MGNSRTENSMKTAYAGLFQKLLVLGLKFVQRTVFIYVLGASYLGISETFANLLGLLSLSELGISGAIAYHLYRPLAEGEQGLLRSLVLFYRKCYFCVGSVILVLGFVIIPFLKYIVPMKDNPGVNMILIYLLYLFSTGLPYLFYSYKTVLPIADQKQFIVTNFNTVCEVLINLIDIIVLLIFRSYMLSFCLRIAVSLLSGFILSRRINSMYPFLKQGKAERLDKERVYNIFRNIKDIFIFRVASALFNATDNLVISGVLGTRYVGYYANYFLIMNAINNTANMLVYAFHASIGNVVVVEERSKQLKVFEEIDFINIWVNICCTVCFAQLLDPLMKVWMGRMGDSEFILSQSLVWTICINYFFENHMRTLYMYRETNGLFQYGKYRIALAGAINVVLSIFLANRVGLIGVFIATAVANIGICSFYYPKIVFEKGYGIHCNFYRIRMIKNFLITTTIFILVRFLCSFAPGSGFVNLILQGIVCIIVVNTCLFLMYRKSEEFCGLMVRIRKMLRR